jgi:cell division protein FtsW (lipid II flippase)
LKPLASRETTLLAIAGLFVLACAAALTLAPFARANSWAIGNWDLGIGIWTLVPVWLLCAVAAHVIVRRRLPQRDPYLLPLVYVLSGWGIALIWRLTPEFGLRQLIWLVVGTAAMLGVTALPGDLRWLRRFRYTWLVAGLALTALTLLIGVNPSGVGERLWLGGFGVYLQPAEILKLLLVVFLAAYLSEKRDLIFQNGRASYGQVAYGQVSDLPQRSWPHLPYFLPLMLMWSFSMVVLLSQRDLGMSTLLFTAFLVMLYLASGQVVYLFVGGLLLIGGGVAGYFLFDVVRVRVEAWWNPWADPSGRSYQIVQSLIAIASGGLIGRGPGLGAPTLIPVAHSDFIFAALAEEWGLLGLLGATALIGAVVLRGFQIALRAPGGSAFEQLLAGGLSALIGVQALLIMGGVLKVIPLTGLTLPFMSYGGSSLLTNFVVVGLLLKLSAKGRE